MDRCRCWTCCRVEELEADLHVAGEVTLTLLTECADLKRENEHLKRQLDEARRRVASLTGI